MTKNRPIFSSTPESAEEAERFGVNMNGIEIIKENHLSAKQKAEAVYMCRRVEKDATPYFDDDEFGYCFKCHLKIRYRPHAPKDIKKVCTVCILGF